MSAAAEHVRTVRLLASLRSFAGTTAITLTTGPEATVRDLFEALRREHPALAARVLTDAGQLQPGVQMVVNGRHIDFLDGLDTAIARDADVVLIPPTAGG